MNERDISVLKAIVIVLGIFFLFMAMTYLIVEKLQTVDVEGSCEFDLGNGDAPFKNVYEDSNHELWADKVNITLKEFPKAKCDFKIKVPYETFKQYSRMKEATK